MQKKSIGFGARGWIVLVYQFLAFSVYCCINNFGQSIESNVNAGMYGWNPTMVPTAYTIASILAVVLQFIFGKKVANSGKVKVWSISFLVVAGLLTIFTAVYNTNEAVWVIAWGLSAFFSVVGATFMASTIVGQWFPRRKGTVMGIATLAFPVINGIGLTIFGNTLAQTHSLIAAWLPWLIVDAVCILLCALFIKEYPEQCGAYPDNDKSMTPEAAKALMEAQAQAKKNSVWGFKNIARTADFWLITIPQGILLLGSVGCMAQVMVILAQFGFVENNAATAVGGLVLLINAAIACVGSWVLGIIDTKFGTKLAIGLSCAIMVLSGILCYIGTVNHVTGLFLVGFALLQIFMGASSNFTVSSAAQYWKREDFPSAFSFINPLANLICAFGPIIVAGIGFSVGFHVVWIIIGVLGLIALILTLLFNPHRILERDKLYRREAGLSEEGLSKSASELMGEK